MEFEEVFSSKPRVKILVLLEQLCSLNVTEISKRIGLNYVATDKHLKILEDEDLIEARTYGRVRMFRFKEGSEKAKAVQNLLETWKKSGTT
ncbi:MAG: winged helix-turn-helix domain-containing protein [Candidatus Bathyarchaeota archaeon]|nr:winged helix-turn-helix domain-containing protein [Candidatus Bathyarchaeota archaeon]